MLASQILHTGFPSLHLTDRVSLALQLMDEYDVQHLPVLSEDHYVGLIAKSDLLDVDEDQSIATIQDQFANLSIKGEEHFLVALKMNSHTKNN